MTVKRKFVITIIDRPFNEMVRNIKTAVIVCTVFKVDDHQFRIAEIITECLRCVAEHGVSSVVRIFIMIATERAFAVFFLFN